MQVIDSGITLPFVKMSGAGNDFVVIDNRMRKFEIDWPGLAVSACHRRYGIGADGLLIIEPSVNADFMMKYFNADGSYGGMCGNGGRCVSSFIMENTGDDHVSFEALDHIYYAQRNGQRIALSMKDPDTLRMDLAIDVLESRLHAHYVDTGAPHVVLFIEDLPESIHRLIETEGIQTIGNALRHHPEFSPRGTNVNFVRIVDEHSISMRTYERGVESETLACGTGAVACSVIASIVHDLSSPISVHTRSDETLTVTFSIDRSTIRHVVLEGSATITFSGEYRYRPSRQRASL